MFRKPKRKATTRARRPQEDERHHDGDDSDLESSRKDEEGNDLNDEGDHVETSELFRRGGKKQKKPASSGGGDKDDKNVMMHSYASGSAARPSHAELATRAAEHHHAVSITAKTTAASASASAGGGAYDDQNNVKEGGVGIGPDGIFRNKARNKFAAGPIRAQTNVRVTARFDYQPDICKDYKDTGFCGYGDTCIYLHDRGDTMSGWQLEQAWEKQQEEERKRRAHEEQVQAFVASHSGSNTTNNNISATGAGGSSSTAWTDDGLPFACFLCRKAFVDPVVTNCGHYFCEACILYHVRTNSELCPVCQHETNSVFNHPAKLVAKMKRVLRSAGASGEAASQQGQDSQSPWQAFFDLLADPTASAAEK
jgi:RING finger protein 113A